MSDNLPENCPYCKSSKISVGPNIPFAETGMLMCHDCGVLLGEEELEMFQSSEDCPHCGTENDFEVRDGIKQCRECGFSAEEEYGSPEIALLWRPGSGIRRMLEQDLENCRIDRDLGRFIRRFCGSHCPEEGTCPQGVRELLSCFEGHKAQYGSGDCVVGRRAKKRRARKLALMRAREALHVAAVKCAAGGWLADYVNGSFDKKQDLPEEPGPGAEAIPEGSSNPS